MSHKTKELNIAGLHQAALSLGCATVKVELKYFSFSLLGYWSSPELSV